MNTKKYLLYKLSAAQAEVSMLETLIAQADEATPEVQQEVVQQQAPAKKETKAKSKPAPVVEEVAEEVVEEVAEEADDMFGEEAAEEAELTVEDVRKVVKAFATKHGKEKAMKLLGKFKVKAIPELKKSDYSKIIELAKKHI